MTLSFAKYVIGLALSLTLTLTAYALVTLHVANHHRFPTHAVIIPTILVLAVLQLIVQAVYFLHLSFAPESRVRLALFAGAAGAVLILGIGSIWVMEHLNARMMSDVPGMEQYMESQSGL